MELKTCRTCKKELSLREFYPLYGRVNLYRLDCRRCYNTNRTARRIAQGKTKRRHGEPLHDLLGKKIGRLTVLKCLGSRQYRNLTSHSAGNNCYFWLCKCACGTVKEIPGLLLTKRNPLVSCGCARLRFREQSPQWSGYSGLSGTVWNKIERNAFHSVRARRQNFKFTITKKYVWDLFQQQKGKCALSGVRLKLAVGSARERLTASLDRIDSNRGYEPGNVQWVHKKLNRMKNDLSDKQFFSWCRLILRHQNIKG